MILLKSSVKKFILIAVFSIAMAYLEAAVVVYLRMIFYPEGFQFSLKIMPISTFLIEYGREFSTIVMLVVIGYLSGKTRIERFFYFIFCFGIWDIFYYVWLKIFLNWPASIFQNDILFLIPIPWVGPILAPIIVSFTMIIASVLSIYLQNKGYTLKVENEHLILTILGCIIILISFLWNAYTINLLEESNPGFQWKIFFLGEVMLITGLILFLKNNSPKTMIFLIKQ
ncbi:MAG: hypothetical protein P4L45_08665 [Ignavibacteriaceae bacterium]|nr:hypothetical protein [Ignavibacteriaceae bacterium]